MESFIQEMKRYLGFTEEDAALLRQLGPRMEKYLPELAERFYSQIPHHPNAFRVFSGGEAQIARLKQTLQNWGKRLFCGVYDHAYAEERYQIGYHHVRIGLEQKYVISAMGIVRAFLSECLLLEFPAGDVRLRYARAVSKMLDLDLNLMCESYMHASMQNLRALNEQLERANRDLAEASRSKDEFLAQVSHELRTPLNSILGFTKLILDGLTKTREEERELLRDVFSSAQHLLGLVNDILDIGRIEAGRMAMHMEDVDPRQVLDSTLPLVTIPAHEKGLELRDETRDAQLPRVRADEVRLRQVLLNLLSNAIKFTPAAASGEPAGRISVRAQIVPASTASVAADGHGFLRLEVVDTGVGIQEEKREAVFELFVQGSAGRRHEGTGLGLAISRRLVQIMGGAIGIQSGDAGSGTTVWFTLPLAGEHAGESPAAAKEKLSARARK
ncbi:MAG: protoglobin domain-containing protein [Acidobacteria bacterium]|nr:protoglobin domain-containing protein [Acidobacteriota bacterium]MCL5287614.1 protoglobin domain-containing protein [Acidobacteriota bacterium]